jgi:hypothetical protein
MCLCGIPYHDYLCDTHRREAEHREGRHTDACHEIEPLAGWRQRTEEER